MTFGLNTLIKGAASLALTLTQVFGFITRADYYYRTDRPLLIAHRGTYGYYPEHALGGYIEAYYAGADFIEFDVQITKDKELVILHDPYLDYCTDIRDHLDRFGHKTYRGWHFVPDFTLAELRTIYLKQRFPFRTKKNNKKFVVLTFQEVIDLIHTLNTEFPRTKNAERKIGLYIELKDWQWNMDWIGYNTADVFWDLLKKNNLETIEKARLDIPIVVQSFELEALEYFRTLGDLPNTFLVGVDCADVWELIYLAYEQLYFMYPYVTWDIIPDWGELANQISGISPDHQYVNRPGAPTDPMTDKWDRLTVVDAYSEFNKMAHDLDLAIHPWPL